MRSILEELWYGNICPNSGCREGTKEVKELMGYIADHYDALLRMLTDERKKTLEKFDDCYAELTESMSVKYSYTLFGLGCGLPLRSSPNRNVNKQRSTTDGRGNLAVCPLCPYCPLIKGLGDGTCQLDNQGNL